MDEFDRAWERERYHQRMLDPAYRQAKRERDRRRERARGRKPAPRNDFERESLTAARRAAKKQALQDAKDARPFVGCDGEGIRDVATGRASYALLRVGDRELYRGGRRLITPECLLFILQALPGDAIGVGFAFDYDVSNILKDVPRERPAALVMSRFERLFASEGTAWTWLNYDGYPEFGVHYRPRNHLKVCLAAIDPKTGKRHAKPGSTRVIYDTWGFFQGTFLAALDKWSIGTPELREQIKREKERRSDFTVIDAAIRDYCRIECELLAELMESFRAVCIDLGARPATWNGAGKLASAMLDLNGAPTRREVEAVIPNAVLDMATEAYYGGRFEVTRVGWIGGKTGGGPVWECDISSAYPAAMTRLPCLRHGRWKKVSGEVLDAMLKTDLIGEAEGRAEASRLFVCPVKFEHPRDQFLCGLPFRSKGGSLAWPRYGAGTYWSIELRSAVRLGATIVCHAGFLFEPGGCECRGYDWVEAYYEERRRIGKTGKGYAIRLGLNAMYGKYAQRIGKPKFANPVTAGLITAMTRATLNDAIKSAGPENVAMLATDAIYVIGKRPQLDFGGGLGQWERKRSARMFIVRPGLYWAARPRGKAAETWKLKTKGISAKFFAQHVAGFQRAWAAYCRRCDDPDFEMSPIVTLTVPLFVGLRYAHSIKRPDLACQWIEHPLEIRFGDRGHRDQVKRGGVAWTVDRRGLILGSKAGEPAKRSMSYRRGIVSGWVAPWEEERQLFEAMPDFVELSPPFK